MKNRILSTIIVAFSVTAATSSHAALLGVTLGFPKITYNNANTYALNYTATNQLLTIKATPSAVLFSASEAPRVITGGPSLQIQVVIDNTGALVGGVPANAGNDFVLSGTVTRIVGGVTSTYTGVLLTGQVIGFGFLESGATDLYDFLFLPTGGALAGFFCGQIAVQVTSESSTFSGDFTVNFNGHAKGNVGTEDLTPPTITCPTNITAECHTGTNGLAGAYVTYPTPTVTDNCDPNPTLICTPSSGSFFPLPDAVSATNYVVTCIAYDAAGNTNVCTFTITVQDTLPPEFADTNNPVTTCSFDAPLTLTNDPGKCYATFIFPRPTATDNCCPLTIPASVSALDENGVTIVLTDLGNGLLQGQFPVDVSGSNIVTVTADDGRGNTTQHQCPIIVVDRDPPTLLCVDQTSTFKPILTNALSCIEADFNNVCIAASNYLWFSSVIRAPSCYGSGAFTVHIFDQSIVLSVDGTNVTLDVPEAYITFSNGVATTTTTFTNGQWVTVTKPGLCGNTFASGLQWQIPFNLNNPGGKCWGRDRDDGRCSFRRYVNSATWCARFAVDKPGVVVQWQWGVTVHTRMSTDCNALCVKPVDDDRSSCYKNSDPAGACEYYKPFLICGGRGNGQGCRGGQPDCTGVLSDCKRANLGKGAICLGAVEFAAPVAVDNCGKAVSVVCSPPSGSILGPGVYPVTCTATDASGNTSQCSFNLTVLSPLQVVFDTPCDDNLDDNTCEPDAGFSDMNCPDDPSTVEQVTQFCSGSKIMHQVRLLDCNGNDVTQTLGSSVTVHIDVTERQGTYAQSVIVTNLPEAYVCVGSPGGIMVLNGNDFAYNLNTQNFPSGTVNNNLFFRSCVWVEYNSSPGFAVGMEDVILESK